MTQETNGDLSIEELEQRLEMSTVPVLDVDDSTGTVEKKCTCTTSYED